MNYHEAAFAALRWHNNLRSPFGPKNGVGMKKLAFAKTYAKTISDDALRWLAKTCLKEIKNNAAKM